MGSVQVLRCQAASEAEEFDRVVILFCWSGTKATGNRLKPELLNEQTIYAHKLTLKRRRGVLTSVEKGFSSFSCGTCGAPIDVGSTDTCRFCHNPLNDGTYDWMMEAVERYVPFDDVEVQAQVSADVSVPDEAEGFPTMPVLELLIAIAGILQADREFTTQERAFLSRLASRHRVSPSQLQECLAAARSAETQIALPNDLRRVKAFLNELLRAAFADGKINRAEREMLLQISKPLAWRAADLKRAISRTRADLLRNARRGSPNRT